jgi:hypothetical protein
VRAGLVVEIAVRRLRRQAGNLGQVGGLGRGEPSPALTIRCR